MGKYSGLKSKIDPCGMCGKIVMATHCCVQGAEGGFMGDVQR